MIHLQNKKKKSDIQRQTTVTNLWIFSKDMHTQMWWDITGLF